MYVAQFDDSVKLSYNPLFSVSTPKTAGSGEAIHRFSEDNLNCQLRCRYFLFCCLLTSLVPRLPRLNGTGEPGIFCDVIT